MLKKGTADIETHWKFILCKYTALKRSVLLFLFVCWPHFTKFSIIMLQWNIRFMFLSCLQTTYWYYTNYMDYLGYKPVMGPKCKNWWKETIKKRILSNQWISWKYNNSNIWKNLIFSNHSAIFYVFLQIFRLDQLPSLLI